MRVLVTLSLLWACGAAQHYTQCDVSSCSCLGISLEHLAPKHPAEGALRLQHEVKGLQPGHEYHVNAAFFSSKEEMKRGDELGLRSAFQPQPNGFARIEHFLDDFMELIYLDRVNRTVLPLVAGFLDGRSK